jgi:hypothetical protein
LNLLGRLANFRSEILFDADWRGLDRHRWQGGGEARCQCATHDFLQCIAAVDCIHWLTPFRDSLVHRHSPGYRVKPATCLG